MKVAVYAICRNEEQFVDRFIESALPADKIVICDTGSQDGTLAKIDTWAKKFPNIIDVHSISILPWRFDFARNVSLGLVPEDIDICVCIDLDEVITEDWRLALETAWTHETTRLRYSYIWSWVSPGIPGVVQLSDKIHARKGYIWRHPCHEILQPYGIREIQTQSTASFAVHHHPDPLKPRAQYLSLLQMGAREAPWCDRSAYYLGREYFFYGRNEEAIKEFERHRSLPSLWWSAERAASHRLQAHAETKLGKLTEACDNFVRATEHDPLHRGGWIDLAMAYYLLADWAACYRSALRALSIHKDHGTYIMDHAEAFGAKAYDLASIAAYHLNLLEESETYATQAVALNPTDARLVNNVEIIRKQRGPIPGP